MKLKSRSQSGFTLVEIMIVVAIIGLLAAIAVPNFVKSRTSSRRSVCIANLKQMADAKVTWAMDNNMSETDQPVDTDLFGSEKYLRRKPVCPSKGTYDLRQVDLQPTCTFRTVEAHSL